MGKFAIGVLVGVVATVTTAVVGATYTARRVRKAVVNSLDDLEKQAADQNKDKPNEEQKNEQ